MRIQHFHYNKLEYVFPYMKRSKEKKYTLHEFSISFLLFYIFSCNNKAPVKLCVFFYLFLKGIIVGICIHEYNKIYIFEPVNETFVALVNKIQR